MGSFFELVTPTNYKYGLIFKISELQKPALLIIINIRKSENSTTTYICTSRGATYVSEGWDTNKGAYSNILLLEMI